MKENKIINVLISNTMRGIIINARKLNIQKEDIVNIIKDGSQFLLVYFGSTPQTGQIEEG